MVNQKGAVLTIVLLLVLGGLIASGAYYLGTQQTQVKVSDKVEATPTALPSLIPQPISTESPKPVSSSKKVTIPSDWKKYPAFDGYYGVETTISVPPGFIFEATGSEVLLRNIADSTEMWWYTPSTKVVDGKLVNSYKGESRREWYARWLNGEFADDKFFKSGEIASIEERFINNTSYLIIKVNEITGKTGSHYLIVENGIVHIFKPSTDLAYTKSAKIPTYMDQILASLASLKKK